MEIVFRIDPEAAETPTRPRWRARRQTATGWVEFPLAIDFERTHCRIGPATFDFRVVGTNLRRNYLASSAAEPFRRATDGRWTVLEMLVPGDRKASFLLAFDAGHGQGMITSVPGEHAGVLRDVLSRLFGSDHPSGLSSPQFGEPEYTGSGVSVDPQHPPGFESGARSTPLHPGRTLS